jgi:HK97 family phage major capsid protein
MTIKFNKTEEFKNAKTALVTAMKDGDEKTQQEAFGNFFDALQEQVSASVSEQVNDSMLDRSILQNRGQNVLTSEETKFFNAAIQEGGFTDESILPVTTQERVFEDLKNEHPLLNAIGLQDMGAVTRIIKADPEGAAIWGKLFGAIQGQVNTAFSEEEINQLKLTAFGVLPNDMLELGPQWVERYIRTLLVEVVSVALEKAFVIGTGNNEPTGLNRDVDPDTGTVTEKTAKGTLTFKPGRTTVIEMKNVVKGLSKNAKGKARKVAGKIVMVVNPFDHFDITASATTQNSNGVYVTNLPFNPEVVESEFVSEGKVIFFVKGQYLAAIAGGYKLKKFDQTLAMEDAQLYTIKQFANGKPLDNNASVVYDLAVAEGTPDAPTNLATSNVTDTSLTLSWDPVTYPEGIANYEIYRNGSRVATSTVASFNDTGLVASTDYIYQVRAIGNNGLESVLSAELTVTTAAAV